MGGIDRALTRFGIHHASARPTASPACAQRTHQRGLTPLICQRRRDQASTRTRQLGPDHFGLPMPLVIGIDEGNETGGVEEHAGHGCRLPKR
jgi:hypothetical protein